MLNRIFKGKETPKNKKAPDIEDKNAQTKSAPKKKPTKSPGEMKTQVESTKTTKDLRKLKEDLDKAQQDENVTEGAENFNLLYHKINNEWKFTRITPTDVAQNKSRFPGLTTAKKAIIINGINSQPQFILEKSIRRNAQNEPDYKLYDDGYVFFNPGRCICFHPGDEYEFDDCGRAPVADDRFEDVPSKVLDHWRAVKPVKQEAAKTRTLAKAATAGLTKLDQKLSNAEEKVSNLETTNTKMSVDLERTTTQLDTTRTELQETRTELGETRTELGKTKTQLKDKNTQVETTTAQNSSLTEENVRLKKENKEVQNKATHAQEDISQMEISKKASKKNCYITIGVLSAIIIVLFIALCCYIYFHHFGGPTNAGSESPSQSDVSDHPSMNRNGTGGAGIGGNQGNGKLTTPTRETTTTRAYPSISAVQRVPVVDLSSPTYDIVSGLFKVTIDYDPRSATPDYLTNEVVFNLNVKSSTNTIRLRCSIDNVTKVSMTSTDGKTTEVSSKTLDTKTQVLTIKLSQPVQQGTLSLQIAYSISPKGFEKLSFPCGVKTCTVFVNRQLRYVVPLLDDMTKHPWKMEISYPHKFVNLLTNTRPNNSVKIGVLTKNDFYLSALLPTELSIAIMENLDKHVYGSQVEVYLPFGTKTDKVANLVDILQKALASVSKVKEMFYMIVVPAMKNYQFIGRNIALVGEDLTGSNTEMKTNFVWTWIYRVMIYDKATSMDRNPTHIYEQSAVFLSTTTKSKHKDKWQKHHYGLAMDRVSSGTKGVHNQKIAFEDEKRYPEKPEHVAMLSTVLGMVASLGNSISGDPLQNLAGDRNNALSARFFFVKSELKLANGKSLNVDKMVSCYVNSPEVSRVHISRLSSSQVAVQRSSGEQEPGCDMNLWIVKGKPNGTNNKEHIVLSTGVEKIQVESQSPVLLSGELPMSAYGYSMDQAEFDKIQGALDSYDQASIKTLVLNGFRAAFDGRLTYESLKKFVTSVLSRGMVSMDEVVDMLIWTISQSHNKLARITEAIASMLNATGQPSDSKTVTTLIAARFEKSIKEFPFFEIEKASLMLKRCGKGCYSHVVDYNDQAECLVKDGKDCSIDSHALEVFVCLKITAELDQYQKYHNLSTTCTGKACRLPTVRGLICTSDSHNLQNWLNKSMTLDVSEMGNRQVVQAIFEGLASNDASKDLLYSYFVDNFSVLYERFSQFPALLGDIIEKTASTITNEEQLVEFKQFVGFYGNDVRMFNEFEEQIQKAEKAVKFNRELLTDFEKHFY